MDDDFGDFTGFSQAPSKSSALVEGDPINTAVHNNGTLNNDFQLPIDNTTSQIDGGVTSFAHFDINFDIPPPLSPPPANIHLAGGVPFDIPPLPEGLSFDEFSPDIESENPFTFNNAAIKVPPSSNVTTAGNQTSHPNIVQPVANLSPPPIDSNWAADFGSFSIPPPPPPPIDIAESGAGCIETTIDATELKLDSMVPQAETVLGTFESVLKEDQEAALPGIDGKETFGDFSTFNTITELTSGLTANTPAESSSMEFTNFASFETALPISTNLPTSVDSKVKEGTFGVLSSLQTKSQPFPIDTSFANFGSSDVPPFPAFEENIIGLEPLKNISSNNDSFGDISTPNGETKNREVTESEKDDFGSFETAKSTSNFAGFGEPIVSSSNATVTVDDFGTFSSGTGDDGFGDFKTSSDDAFGDFKTSSDDGDFGDFTSGNTGFGGFSSAGFQKSAPSIYRKKEDVGSVLVSCFVLEGTLNEGLTSASELLTQLLGTNTRDKMNPDVWQSLQRCIDLTIPLYKWDSSSLRDNFYSAIKVDPMLISRPSTLSVLTGHTKFADPLGGTTAAEDLMESFGFEGEVEESRQSSASSPSIMGPTGPVSGNRATPTLLDLSLPETPGSPTGRNFFKLTEDLMGLDLNPQPQNQQLTSIQELLRNESLVVNKSKWVDSKLQEFGEGETEKTSSQPSTPGLGKRQNTVELQLQQLGLDANKVSSFTGKRRELSLGARTVLGRLPELSFMLATDRVVQTHQYSI